MESNEVTEREETNEASADGARGNEAAGNEEFDLETLRNILEGLLLAAARPLSLDQMQNLLGGETAPDKGTIRRALKALEEDCAGRGIELVEVASGFRLQVRQELQPWVSRLWEERPPRYSRALLETLALIAYKQPITRGEIEDVRGVSVSTNIIRQLEEREWIRVVGHRDVPGKPALFGTTKAFLDYFGLKSLDDLPSLAEIRDIDSLEPELDFSGASREEQSGEEAAEQAAGDEAEAAALEAEAAESGSGESAPVVVTDRPEDREAEVSADEDIAALVPEAIPVGSSETGSGPEGPGEDDENSTAGTEENTVREPESSSSGEPGEDEKAERGERTLRDNEAASGGRY